MTVGSSVFDQELRFQPSIMLLAQQGDCRAIAQWLNPYLRTQGIQAQVMMDRPRCLRVLVEFEHVPHQQRLIRFICHRLCKLNSATFNTVRIQAQYLGTQLVLWEQTVRLALPSMAPASAEPLRAIAPNASTSALVHVPSPLPPRLTIKRFTTPPWLDASQLILFKHPLLLAAAMLAFWVGASLDFGADPTAPSVAKGGNRSVALPLIPRGDRIKTSAGAVTVHSLTDIEDAADEPVTLTFSSDAVLQADPSSGLNQAIDAADVSFVHLNQPIQPHNGAEPTDAGLSIEQLQTQGIDLVNAANEPLLSQNRAAFAKTLRSLDRANIPTVGSGRNRRDARRPEIVEVRGQRIAYLGYSDADANAASWSMGVNPADDDHIAEDIQAIRDQVDWVVVTYRWSGYLADYPADWQVRLAHWAVDHGADLVVGYHPEVLQGAEIYKGRAIVYSLGDFIYADSQTSAQDYKTAALQVAIRDRQMKLDFLPIQVRQGNPTIVRGREGRAILQYIKQASGLFESPLQLPIVLDERDRSSQPSQEQPDESAPVPSDSFISYPEQSTLPSDADPRAFIDDPSLEGNE